MKNFPYFSESSKKIFQQNGAPAHYAVGVRAALDKSLNRRWFGKRASLAENPPRSPDLTVPDFYLWGHIKAII